MQTNSPMGWPESRDLSPLSSQAALEGTVWVWSWRFGEYQGRLPSKERAGPKLSLNAKQDGVLTGSPFPKGIEEESPGGQRSFNFL